MRRAKLTRNRNGVVRNLLYPDSLVLLEEVFLEPTPGVTIIAIDCEYLPTKSGGTKEQHDRKEFDLIHQIGISTFSTDDWAIHSHRYGAQQEDIYKYKFLFEESHPLPTNKVDIARLLVDAISYRSPADEPQKVVLVGHSITTELRMLQELGVDLLDSSQFKIEGILDTFWLATKLLDVHGGDGRLALGGLLQRLEIPYKGMYLHDAGNDAHFTLKLLLKLTAVAFERREIPNVGVIERLKAVAQAPIDYARANEDKKAKMREYRAEIMNADPSIEAESLKVIQAERLKVIEAERLKMGTRIKAVSVDLLGDEESFDLGLFGNLEI